MALSRAASWGPKITTKSYILEMAAESIFSPVYKLPGHSLGAPEAETQDAVMIREFEYTRGFIVEHEFYHRKAFNRAYSYPLVLAPSEVLWSALNKVANGEGTCRRDFFASYLCSDDSSHSHFWYFPDAILDEILQTNMLIATTDDEEAATHETTLRVSRRGLYYAAKVQEQSVVGSGTALYAIDWKNANCVNCPTLPFQSAITGGTGGGTLTPLYYGTTDRFATSSALTNSIPGGSIITDIHTDGDIVIATFADVVDTSAGTAASGGVLVSYDGGTTNTIATSPTTALYAITQTDEYYIVAGKSGTIYKSVDGLNWTLITNAAYVSGDHYTDAAYDKDTGYVYFAGYNSTASVAHRMYGDAVSNITTQVAAGTNLLFRVAVLSENQILYGGASGILRWTEDITDGASFTLVSVAGTTGAIRAIVGNKARVWIGAGTNIYERSRLTEGIFSRLVPVSGTTISGNITSGAGNVDNLGLNYALFTTSVGEVIALQPYFPGA